MGTAPGVTRTKAEARVAMLGLDDASAAILANCFRQFGIEAVALPRHADPPVHVYRACVVPLVDAARDTLRHLREQDRHVVLYGVCGSILEAMPFSAFGINAVFETPVNRQDALDVVRTTHLLVLKELRRYVRVPLISSIRLKRGKETLAASSLEVSAGGLSIRCDTRLHAPESVVASFELPGVGPLQVRSVVCWRRDSEGSIGLRFEPDDERRLLVRRWIDDYLDA